MMYSYNKDNLPFKAASLEADTEPIDYSLEEISDMVKDVLVSAADTQEMSAEELSFALAAMEMIADQES
jgi:hypothetical protein